MAITLVVKTKKASTDNVSVTTDAIDTTNATLLLLFLVNAQGNPSNTVSDNKTNTWTPLTAQENTGAGRGCWYYVNTNSPNVGSGHTFTADDSFPATTYPTLFVYAFQETAATPYDNRENGINTEDNVESVQAGSVTPSEGNCLVVFGVTWYDTVVGPTIDGGFSTLDTILTTTNNIPGGASYLIQTSVAAANPTASWTNLEDVTATIAVFKSAGGGGGAGFIPFPKPRGEAGGQMYLTGGMNE